MANAARLALILVIALLPCACLADLRPAPVGDLREIAGVWEGDLRMAGRAIPIVVAINPDGRADIEGDGQRVTASLKVAGGEVHWQASSGNAVSRLFRDGQTSVLRLMCRDGSCTADLRPRATVPPALAARWR